jgi:hypothetical protein
VRSPSCLCVCLSLYPPYQILNAWTNLYETWYVYHGTWAHFNGVLHKSLQSVCVSICVSPYRCHVTAGQTRSHGNEYTQRWEELLDASFSIQSVSYRVCVSPILVYVPPKRWSEDSQSRQRVKYVHESRGTRNQESLCWRGPAAIYRTGLCISLSLLGNGSVSTFPWQRGTVGGVVFYAVRVVWKESRRLVVTRTTL